jgi:hypothetical protein
MVLPFYQFGKLMTDGTLCRMSDKLRNITTKDKHPKDQAITSQNYKTNA